MTARARKTRARLIQCNARFPIVYFSRPNVITSPNAQKSLRTNLIKP